MNEENANLTPDEDEDLRPWERSRDPAVLKAARTAMKATHTRSVNKVMKVLIEGIEAFSVKQQRSVVVRDFDELNRRNMRYMKYRSGTEDSGLIAEQWIRTVSEQHMTCLTTVDNYFQNHDDDVPSHRSQTSSRASKTSQLRAKLLESERLEKETELRLKQEQEESRRQIVEQQQLKENQLRKKAHHTQVEADRRQRSLLNSSDQQCLSSSILRQ